MDPDFLHVSGFQRHFNICPCMVSVIAAKAPAISQSFLSQQCVRPLKIGCIVDINRGLIDLAILQGSILEST